MNYSLPTTSVALCTFNGEQYIQQQLQSISDQTNLPGEIIICDDGSADKTIGIINQFKKNAKIDVKLFINERRLGSTNNFEKAIGLCSGEIIFLCDQDDIWAKDKIEKLCLYFKDNPSKCLVFTNAFLIENGLVTKNTLWQEILFNQQDDKNLFSYLLVNGNVATGATLAVKKSCVARFLPFTSSNYWLHDGQLVLQAAVTNSAGFLPDCLTYYRRHHNQLVGISKFVPSPFFKRITRILYHSKKIEREHYFIEEENIIELVKKHSHKSIAENIDWINSSEFFRKQLEKAFKSNFIVKGFLLSRLFVLGKYKYVSSSKKRHLSLFIKDFIGK